MTVNSGATLGGSGSVANATVNAGGVLAPGSTLAPGALDLSDSLSLLSGAELDYRLGTPANSDIVLMPAGTLILAGLQFTDFLFAPLAGFGPGEYTLIEAGSITGSLGTSVSGTVEGRSATLAIEGNDLVLNVVPEPRRGRAFRCRWHHIVGSRQFLQAFGSAAWDEPAVKSRSAGVTGQTLPEQTPGPWKVGVGHAPSMRQRTTREAGYVSGGDLSPVLAIERMDPCYASPF